MEWEGGQRRGNKREGRKDEKEWNVGNGSERKRKREGWTSH